MKFVLGCIIFTWLVQPSAGQYSEQQSDGSNLAEEMLSFYAPFVFPKIFQDVHRLRAFIGGEEFATVRTIHGDVYAVDRIFSEAMEITWNNRYEALLIAAIATMDHRRVGIRFPIPGPLLWFPLTSEFPDEFEKRMGSLPRMLYPDSPSDRGGDRDKLQHFFGSAFIAFSFESGDVADRVGYAVEAGEERFIAEGRADERDTRANNHGRSFGLTLLTDKTVVPSDFLQLVTALGSLRYDTSGDKHADFQWCGPSGSETGRIKEAR